MKRCGFLRWCALTIILSFTQPNPTWAQSAPAPDLWQLANGYAGIHRYSTLFTAHDVRHYLSDDKGIQDAVKWCKQTGVTKVYVEEFRDGYQAERAVIEKAKQQFQAAGLQVSGCVTTTRVGKPSTGWKEVACCFTDQKTQEKLQAIFEYAASLFDEIMIDDFWFTDCACAECDAARKAGQVTVGQKTYPVRGQKWEDYRCELMVRLSQERVLAPARHVNPKVKLIIKYPQWYDDFHNRGYEVARETQDFDRIWVGTETRDFDDAHWGGTAQYEACFIMRWLGAIGGDKCGGGWFDPYGTTEATYIEQARQTILGGARESMLFCYNSLLHDTGPKNIEALRTNLTELLATARQLNHRHPLGVAAYKPPNSHPDKEAKVFDFVGMLGLPLVPGYEFPTNAPAAFLSVHALKDAQFLPKLTAFIKTGKPVLLTDGLVQNLTNCPNLDVPTVQVLTVNHEPKSLLKLDQLKLDKVRALMLSPLQTTFTAPDRVALYLFDDKSWVVENFNNESVAVTLNGKSLTIPARSWRYEWK